MADTRDGAERRLQSKQANNTRELDLRGLLDHTELGVEYFCMHAVQRSSRTYRVAAPGDHALEHPEHAEKYGQHKGAHNKQQDERSQIERCMQAGLGGVTSRGQYLVEVVHCEARRTK